jgi:UDP-N-acetylmuramate--alanine ligase
MVVDDYAHHPTEIRATLNAATKGWDRRIISVFQPHLFTRTQAFFREFAGALLTTDILIITDIYPAREKPIPGITAELIVNEAINQGHSKVHYVPDLENLTTALDNIVQNNDMVLTMGAGSIWRYSDKYAAHLEKMKTRIEI